MKELNKFLAGLILLILSACSSKSVISGSVSDPDLAEGFLSLPTFEVDGVTYRGKYNSDQSIEAYLGVPFAQPPLGKLRWMPPRPLISNSHEIDVQEFAPACIQGPHLANWYKGVIESFGGNPATFPLAKYSEDCLYLNIWKPVLANQPELVSAPLPVYVFIHGGSNKGGWSYEPNYIGERLAQHGVMVITVAYRLGVFGFFSHPEIEHSNFGLLDQIAALTWVQNNVAALGGDPASVTVAGESAGANNIAYLMSSPLAKGLFQRVVFESGGWAMWGASTKQESSNFGLKLQANVLGEGDTSSLMNLKNTSANTVLERAAEVYRDHFFDPVIDGNSVVTSVSDAAISGELAKVDLIIGANADEQLMYLDANETLDKWFDKNVSVEQEQQLRPLLESIDTTRDQLNKLATAQNYVCPSLKLARAVTDAGGRAWFYHFSKQRDGELGAKMGAYHGAELPYIFDTHDDWLPTSQQDRELTESISEYWVQFIQTGNPNVSRLPAWPAYAAKGDVVLKLDTNIQTEVHNSERLCDVLMP